MSSNLSRPVVGVGLVVLMLGCQPKTPPPGPSTSSAEELRLLTPEQEQALLAESERVEKRDAVTQPLKDATGAVVGTVTSQTTVIYLKAGGRFGAGRFNVNTTCTSTCTGNPINLNPSLPSNVCACDSKCSTCTGPVDAAGCTGSCTETKTGFGNFGLFIL